MHSHPALGGVSLYPSLTFSLTAPALWVRVCFFSHQQPGQAEAPTALLIILPCNLRLCPHVSLHLPQHACLLSLFRTSLSFPDLYLNLSPRICTWTPNSCLTCIWHLCAAIPRAPTPSSCTPCLGQAKGRRQHSGLLIISGLHPRLAFHSSADHIPYPPKPVGQQVLLLRPEHVHRGVLLDFTLPVAVPALTSVHTEPL